MSSFHVPSTIMVKCRTLYTDVRKANAPILKNRTRNKKFATVMLKFNSFLTKINIAILEVQTYHLLPQHVVSAS